jgi:hypothetical protein
MKIDLTKGVDFKPLKEIGINEKDGMKLLTAMMPFIQLELRGKIVSAFEKEELTKVGEEAVKQGIKPEEGIHFLEEKYQAKTGRYFMEEMRLLLNEYVGVVAEMVRKVRGDVDELVKKEPKRLKEYDELIKKKQWAQAAKLFEEMAGG